MAITTLSMVLTVFVLNLHHITDRPVPGWLKKFVLVFLAKMMCMCHYDQYAIAYEEEKTETKNKYRVMPNKSLGKVIGSQIGLLNGTVGQSKEQTKQLLRKSRPTPSAMESQHGTSAGAATQFGNQFSPPHALVDDNEARQKSAGKKMEEEWSRDWKHVAEVMDRLFFWLFLSAIVITTLLLFHPLTKAYFQHVVS